MVGREAKNETTSCFHGRKNSGRASDTGSKSLLRFHHGFEVVSGDELLGFTAASQDMPS